MQLGRSKSMATLRVGSLVLPLIGSLIWGLLTYADERRRALDQAEENVALVRQYAQRVVETQTIMQDAAAAHVRGQADPDYLVSADFHRFLAEIEARQAVTHGLAVIGLDGWLAASSRSYPVNLRFTPRDYLDAIEAGQALYLDRLLLEPDGQDALVVAQPFNHGSYRGVIASAVAVEAVREFLRSVAARQDEAASLLRADGKLLVRQVPSQPTILDPASPARRAMESAPSGSYQARAATDGIERLYAYSKLGDLPIYANFGVPVRLVWIAWGQRVVPVWLLLAAGGLFSFVLASLVERSIGARLAHEEQTRLRQQAEARAEQQQQFMRELNHRVKNNLAMVDSLIAIQLRKNGQVDAQELRTRIAAIADVHDLLYRAADAQELDLGDLLERICGSPALIPAERGIACQLHMDRGLIVTAGEATSLALALVELVTNAVKHAFPSGPGTITIRLQHRETSAELTVCDDGIGLPQTSGRSSGIRIVEALVAQVGGTLTRTDGHGTGWQITLPRAASPGPRSPARAADAASSASSPEGASSRAGPATRPG